MPDPLPRTARLLGLAGLLPFLGSLALAAAAAGEARGAALWTLAIYGAVILSFLGAVHWGLALGPGAPRAVDARLALGVLPSLVAWAALLLPPQPSLLLLAAGLLATAGVETLASRRGLLGAAYLRLRWRLSLAAAASLLAGASIAS